MKPLCTLFSALLLSQLCLAQDMHPVIEETPMENVATATEDLPFTIVEVIPAYQGGDKALMDWIAAEIRFPIELREQHWEGKVFVSFIIGTDGSIESARIARGLHPLLDEEALRVVKGIKGFSPGLQGGKAVRVQYIVPVAFVM